jgi:hydrogenase nickel incorporation protein HypB
MCGVCGCGQPDSGVSIKKISQEEQEVIANYTHSHSHHHHSPHAHPPALTENRLLQKTAPTFVPQPGKTILQIERNILDKNQQQANQNRRLFKDHQIATLNLVSSPGSGKTALLERTLADLQGEFPCFVIEGDQQTSNDARRIAATGAPVVQINTGKGCHLEADMVSEAVRQLEPSDHSLLFIENVGNLVCPAMFDLGETARVVIISVTEGEDKPLKYPDMFHSSQLCLINKIDLLPYVNFDLEKAKSYARQVSHLTRFIEVSATTGQGMEEWYQWLRELARPASCPP